MKLAIASLRAHLLSLNAGVGLEGWLLGLGTLCLAIGASFVSPAGPWLVVGGVALVLGVALVVPARRPS